MYKEIVLSYDKNLTAKDIRSIETFNQFYREDEIRLEIDFNHLFILLREIDLFDIKNKAIYVS